jgi:hypothetical protein
MLKSAAGDPGVEQVLGNRLAAIARDQESAAAARTIESILANSHDRDGEVDLIHRRLEFAGKSKARGYSAVGYIQPSSEELLGHKLFLLIGREGSTIAYLDIPAGLDIEPLLARRVGVRGDPHYSEDLGSRLISVRDVEPIEARP